MFLSAGQPGNIKKLQGNVAAARKVFRVLRPLESLAPIINNPSINPNKPLAIEILAKLKPILMAIYFGGDHVVWASQAGFYTNKFGVNRAQKTSLYGWFGGSLCTIAIELYELSNLVLRKEGESEEEFAEREAKCHDEINKRLLTLIHACFQAALAMGLLELRPWKPRTVGMLGIVASAMNCYILYPSISRPLWQWGRGEVVGGTGGKPAFKTS
jgi:hypothetical protein